MGSYILDNQTILRVMQKPQKGKFYPNNPTKYKGNPGKIIYRSSWELACMRWFDNNKNIIEWQSEERAIIYRSPVDQQIHRYFPDFVIKVKSKKGTLKTYMIEVKPFSQTRPPKKSPNKQKLLKEAKTYAVNQAKWNAAKTFCSKRGWEFKILTEKEIFGYK